MPDTSKRMSPAGRGMDIPGYEIGECLLRTARVTVHRGRRAADGAPVLLKRPEENTLLAPDTEALLREHSFLLTVSARGFPRALEVVRTSGSACLVIEDSGLRPLATMLAGGPLDLAVALRIALQVSAILAELHRRGFVHGAVQPAALLASEDGAGVQLLEANVAARAPADLRTLVAIGCAPYMSPEQTGRINREIDYRTDFYSLGATLYELIAGRPPFPADDPLELVHAHIARPPTPLSALVATVPDPLARVVERLLAKAPEDRYQSAAGIRHDLERCERGWRERGAIAPFAPGEHDVPEHFLLPQKLYGRERELAALLDAFDRTCEGRTTLLLVSGYSGAGKTALINELCRPILRLRGYFIVGKFDQVARNLPYGALIQAFRSLVGQLLTESESRLAAWRASFARALGPNAGVLSEVCPEIELIIGAQPPPTLLDPAEAQNRFQYVIQSFVGTVARAGHPLVIFLDDVQWADAATLGLLRALATTPDIGHLLIICAYRDNEVDAAHPVTRTIEQLEQAGADLRRVFVPPLGLADLTAFISDALRDERRSIEPLARLVRDQTDGNPFFVIQFLKALEQEHLLAFDHERSRWSFRLDAIRTADMTDDIVELMTRKIRRLTPPAQHAVTLAACIGNRFEWDTLVTVGRKPAATMAAALAEVVDAGLVRPVTAGPDASESGDGPTEVYAFLHDRVQQAAYAAIEDDRKPPLHLDVGRLLLARFGAGVPDDRLFEIVNHLAIGRRLIETREERTAVARLCLLAGRRAKASAAYAAAAHYLDSGIELLAGDDREGDYELMFAVHLEAAECQYLAGAFATAERYFERLLRRAATVRDRAQIHTLRIVLYENQSRWAEAVSSGREGLALFGIALPEGHEATQAALDRELDACRIALGSRSIASLVELPVMENPDVRLAMRTLTTLWAPSYISGDQLLARLISATLVRLSLEHGNTEDSAYGYVTHAITIGPVKRDYAAAFAWGQLALAVNERFNDTRRRAKIQQQFQAHVNLWCRPFATCIPHAREARRSGLETGDFTYAGYGAVTESWSELLITRDLEQFVQTHTPTLALLERIKMSDFRAALQVVLNWARALQGRTAAPVSLTTADFDEEAFVETYRTAAPFFLTFVYTARLHLACLLDEHDVALAAARQARAVAVAGTIWPVLVEFWEGLAAAAVCEPPADDNPGWQQLMTARQSMGELAAHCPENFRCFHLLLSAEALRLEGRTHDAAALFEEAIRFAAAHDQLQHEALASELCGRMWASLHRDGLAAPLLAAAHRCYRSWGAAAKAAHLERRYPHLLAPLETAEAGRDAPADPPLAPAPADDTSLDMSTVIKLAHAVAVELELEGLLRTLIRLAIENAGAERGVFISERDGGLAVEAEATTARGDVHLSQLVPLDQAADIPRSVVRYVHRTGHDLVIGDAANDERFGGDPDIRSRRSRSILCVPVGRQGRLGGILYLENNLTAQAFTPDRIEVMRILAAQAAISLENARLYSAMKDEIGRRKEAETALREALSQVESLKNRLEAENVYLQEEIRTQHNFEEIVGNSPVLLDALRRVERVAPTDSTVLILGETGVGKELFARAVHNRSTRRGRPLVKVNCGAIAPGLVESELFGHVKGAFTGAIDKRVGRFELADGGTIFLDEIGELPLEAQIKLLRVLQEQEFEPVGSSRTVRVSVRVIAATNRDLDQAVREGRFRPDLLYRLNVFPIEVPPLRQRGADVALLAGFFVAALSRRLGKPIQGISSRSMRRILSYSWPGNVRELENVIERAAILAQSPVLEVDDALGRGEGGGAADVPSATTLDDVQRLHIVSVLRETGGVVEGAKGAASRLGLHPNTLRSRMKKLGITPGR